MMKLIFVLFIALCSAAQDRSVSIRVTSGPIVCTFTNFYPMALTGLHMTCTGEISTTRSDTVIAIGQAHSGQYSEKDKIINWNFFRPDSTPTLVYKLIVDGQVKTGSL